MAIAKLHGMTDADAKKLLRRLVTALDRRSLDLEREAARQPDAALGRSLMNAATSTRDAAEELSAIHPVPAADARAGTAHEDLDLERLFQAVLEVLRFGAERDLVVRRFLDVRAALDDAAFRRSFTTTDHRKEHHADEHHSLS